MKITILRYFIPLSLLAVLVAYYGGLVWCVRSYPPTGVPDWLVVVFVGSAPGWPLIALILRRIFHADS